MGLISLLSTGAANLLMWGQAHSAALLTAAGTSLGLGSVLSGIFATKAVTRKYDEEAAERSRLGEPEMTAKEKFMLVAPYYIPTVLLFGGSAACIILNTLKQERAIATLAGLYTVTEKSFAEYQEKVKDMFGEGKERKVRNAVAEDKAQEARHNNVAYILTGNGEYPCLEAWTGTKFRSSQMAIERARINIKERLINEMYISLQEAEYELELPQITYPDGSNIIDKTQIGWNRDDELDFDYTYCGDPVSGEPMLVINYRPAPHPNYNNFW